MGRRGGGNGVGGARLGHIPGGSRMAWVLGYGRRVLEEARTSGRVPAQARVRNGARAVKTLSAGEQATLRALAAEPLGVDSDAAAVVDKLAREVPPPHVLLVIALSSLTIRGIAAPIPQEHADD